ncbi:AraC family transcriptional regulator [Anaeroselena agilis]|uniref:AraC family transcriptional regulator n=1 Tax=Anaeroselena agilis TaxID=3063788 RepID=A0ABU3NVE2_9FIRM|nr:AraC family transcriptional regulator [Selenomonadales bacterium 4137-cl]
MQITDIRIDANRRETTLHGSYDFPVAVYLDQLDKNILGFVNWHWHEEIQLSFVTKGQVEFRVNQSAHILSEGQGIFINSGCLHMARAAAAPDSTYICINVDPRLLSFFPGSAIEQKYSKPLLKSRGFSAVVLESAIDRQRSILVAIEEIFKLYNRKAFAYEFDIGLALATAWRQLVAMQSETAPEEDAGEYLDQQRIKTLMAYINEHYMEKLALREIAAAANISKGECCRFFKRAVKCTVFEYVMNCRINKSIGLLKETGLTVSQIADAVGFGSTSYFIECFKKKLSCTPKEYRNRLAARDSAPPV